MTIKKVLLSALGGGVLGLLLALFGPAGTAHAATIPVDLYAVTGSTTLPTGGQSVQVWGYSASNAPVSRPGGPTLVVQQGDTVQITLHNELGVDTGLLVQGQRMVPDRSGTADGTSRTYEFVANRAGTYLYEAAPLPGAQYQVAMGLHGALVVRPATAGRAYDGASSAYDDEAVLVLSEIDPLLNNAANKAGFDLRKFHPRYFLVNGEVHPDADPIPTMSGKKVLLRYLNAGLQYHSMAVLGASQRVIALDGSELAHASTYVAETFGPGQTTDAIVTAPTTTTTRRLPLYDGNLLLHNTNTAGFGGMVTTIDVTGAGSPSDTVGPVPSNLGYAAGTLTANLDGTTTGGGTVAAAVYYLDVVSGPGIAMAATDGTFDAVSENVTAAVAVPAGEHTLFVRGQDNLGNWGPLGSVMVLGGDATGPVTSAATVTPSPANGATAVAVHATGNDTSTGGSDIGAAEFFIGTPGVDGSGSAMTFSPGTPTAALDGSITVGTLGGLGEATHVISIHSRDVAGNWGPMTTVDLVVDKTGPTASGVVAVPNPNNGTLAVNASTPAVRVTATNLADGASNVRAAEAFVDTVGADGTGIPMAALDGAYNSGSEAGYADIPLTTVAQLSSGGHTIYVHAKDAAGNWGAPSTTVLLIDKVRPTVSGLTATPNPTGGAATVNLSASATDAATSVVRAEWFRGTDPGAGKATAMAVTGTGPWSVAAAINTTGWGDALHTIRVRVRDAAGNWSATTSAQVNTSGALHFSTAGNTNPPGVTGAPADNSDIYGWDGSAYSRVWDATGSGIPGGANVDAYDEVDANHFYLSFSTNTTISGLGTVQDEDVVYYDNGVWSVYFNGTAHGLTSNNHDIDAISIVGSTLYFSTVGNSAPPGVGGTADDADIYRWNGSSYARVWDATANGLPGAANVDGLARVNGTHFYLSFGDNTTVPGLGTVQDEDVVFYNAGSWSVYFNGTSHGLTSNNLDVDAFDVP